MGSRLVSPNNFWDGAWNRMVSRLVSPKNFRDGDGTLWGLDWSHQRTFGTVDGTVWSLDIPRHCIEYCETEGVCSGCTVLHLRSVAADKSLWVLTVCAGLGGWLACVRGLRACLRVWLCALHARVFVCGCARFPCAVARLCTRAVRARVLAHQDSDFPWITVPGVPPVSSHRLRLG